MFVPAHAEAGRDMKELVQYNREKVYEVSEFLEEICREALTFETILQKVFDRYRLTMTFEQYVLVGSTVRSYLSWLKDKGRLSLDFTDNLLRWKSV